MRFPVLHIASPIPTAAIVASTRHHEQATPSLRSATSAIDYAYTSMPTPPLDFHKLMAGISKRLQARVDLSAVYAHPSGVGDDREYAVIDALREVLPTRYGIAKGRVFDSLGHISAELDIVIYEADELFLGLEVGGRRLIPIESVYAIVEVKSRLDQEKFNSSLATLRSIEPLQRFFRWTDQIADLTPESEAKVSGGIPATERFMNVGSVWSSIVSFETVEDETLAGYLQSAPAHLIFVCTPGHQLVTKWVTTHQGFKGLRIGEEALGLYAWGVMDLLTTNSRKRYFTPDLRRYRARFVDDLGEMKAWDLTISFPSPPADPSGPGPAGPPGEDGGVGRA